MSGTGSATGGPAGLRVSYLLAAAAGGTGRHVAMLAAGCAARGATVHVYGPAATREWLSREDGPAHPRDAPPAAAEPGLPGPATPGSATSGSAGPQPGWDFSVLDIADRPRPARDAGAVLRLRRLLARDTPDVLHAHGLRAGALAALALAGPGAPRTRLAVTVHNAPPDARLAAAVYAGLQLIVARRADAVLTVSGDLDRRMRRRGARLAGRALVPALATPTPSPAEIAALRRELAGHELAAHELAAHELAGHELASPELGGRDLGGRDPGSRDLGRRREIVLGVGRLASQKGFGTLILAAARWQRRPAVPLVLIAGAGPLEADLRRQAETAGVAVLFLGPRRDLPALLAVADVVVVSSTWEGQPLIVQEALRAGRPLVATRVGGVAELTGDEGAVLVPPGDPVALAAAVSRLLDDPEAAARLAEAGRARAAEFPSAADAVDQVLGVYQTMTSRPGIGRP